jgi:HSP20 family protein
MQRDADGPNVALNPLMQEDVMARETSNQRDQSSAQRADQSGGESFDKSGETKNSYATQAATGQTGQTDRERSIQTDREGSRSKSVARRQGGSPSGSTSNPYQAMRRMADEMDRLFESFGFGRAGFGLAPLIGSDIDRDLWRAGSDLQSVWAPQVETFRRGDKLVVRADLPGLNKDDVKVEVDDGQLTISGERCDENEETRDDYYRSERSYGQFYRAIPLPDGVDAAKCDASFKDGVLEVTLDAPKEAERKAKRVQIR